ncbi:glycoside hydrolase family 2 TIM barrel-domain containing protein [Pelagicoccus sp. SDUM812002]|uniref:glycoside hydrolase family 2 TIM barrel-domain containing protein n=1 Tax=Pelagicoccus sp. SDUM812002 TaxID=3041266 RepID=UPI00280DE5D2|nr:glycoside hydrolase family 2 TIM barrel-domain containing protein [Pelagicoccus sp. SDUM812002]MDQ8185097.1 glycoside hydrolase family 2 TIM barrel-domain containing protein [Pelagicoccus sp. SDUM812002]
MRNPFCKFPFLAALSLIAGTTTLSHASPQTLADNWSFHLGDLLSPDQSLSVDDFNGTPVRIPHDWAAAGPFDPDAHGGTGKLPWQGIGWYRRTLEIPASAKGHRIYLDFDGAMAFPVIYLNGEEIGSWDYGYTPFRIDLTDHAKPGEDNILAVRLDTRKWSSRWYPGAGLYRKVTLSFENPIHIAQWGLGIRTDGDERLGLPAENATLSVALENHTPSGASVVLDATILDPHGEIVATASLQTDALSQVTTHRKLTLHVKNPRLWDINSPERYTAQVQVLDGDGGLLDEKTEKFGFRTFAFTANDGFHLNGRRVQLKGVNLHSDLGPLGMAFNRYAQKRQLQIMMEMGINAIRTAHNPPAEELLELCDELGLVVWDEVFDKWAWTAGRDDLTPPLMPFAHRHIRNTLMRDRNHPSVVVWSIGNEVNGGEEGEGVTPERTAMLAGFARNIDDSRPIAMACHIPSLTNGENFASIDLAGWNYARRYERYRAVWPEKPIIYSESASALSTRGYYDPDLATRTADYGEGYEISSYDLNAAFWSDLADQEFEYMKTDSFVAGEFVWTGFDYIGEPTPHDADSRSSYFGIVDLCGFLKDRYFLYRSHWREDLDTVHILPHWNWEGSEGKNVPVFVYTNGDSAELFLNGKSLGKRRKGERPDRSENLALAAMVTASSGEHAARAIDADIHTAWLADTADNQVTWTIDLGNLTPVQQLQLDTNGKEHLFAYAIESSADGEIWSTVVEKPTQALEPWQGTNRILHAVDTKARFLRLSFTEATGDATPGLRDFRVFAEPTTNDYYDVTYDYRLRWDDVSYQPGTLKAVAYKDSERIGEAIVETTGKPVALRLVAERSEVDADGVDLIYVTAEAIDSKGRACPLADDEITFSVSGAGTFEATGNGDQRSFVAFSSSIRKLFYGKAQLIARPTKGSGGTITIKATAKGLKSATAEVTSR